MESFVLQYRLAAQMLAFLSEVMVTRRRLEPRNMLTKTFELRVRSVEGTTLPPRIQTLLFSIDSFGDEIGFVPELIALRYRNLSGKLSFLLPCFNDAWVVPDPKQRPSNQYHHYLHTDNHLKVRSPILVMKLSVDIRRNIRRDGRRRVQSVLCRMGVMRFCKRKWLLMALLALFPLTQTRKQELIRTDSAIPWRSSRQRKQNPKYANAALIEERGFAERTTYKGEADADNVVRMAAYGLSKASPLGEMMLVETSITGSRGAREDPGCISLFASLYLDPYTRQLRDIDATEFGSSYLYSVYRPREKPYSEKHVGRQPLIAAELDTTACKKTEEIATQTSASRPTKGPARETDKERIPVTSVSDRIPQSGKEKST
ncbi:hypothetical protein COLO4_29987 [Corchorus olitorius]|uniref:Uncharacterized protein n=1 Tax=Corchorus olitorius TaxID=93759 RepID=A0A1R3HBV3_9ROSI|nr:hypothetical protein COLO4_29987 [Corchorus olitorius]